MTRFEKIYLGVLAGTTALALVSEAGIVVTLSLYALAVAYGTGGYWLFRLSVTAPVVPSFVRVGVGLVLAAALVQAVNSVRLRHGEYEQATPALLGAVAVGLGAYWFRHRGRAELVAAYRPLFFRTAAVFAGAAFLAYAPIKWSWYRSVALALNAGIPHQTANLRAFDFAQRADEAMENQDCSAGVQFAKRSYALANLWLGEDSIRDRHRINGTYSTLYRAYKCQGDAAFEAKQYEQALRSHLAGHAWLVRGNFHDENDTIPYPYWREERAWSLNNLGHCYQRLQRLQQSDSAFTLALVAYRQLHPAPDAGTATLLRDLAGSLGAGKHWALVTPLYRQANRILAQDTTAKAAANVTQNTLSLALAYLSQDSTRLALDYLRRVKPAAGDSTTWYTARMYEGIVWHKLSRYPQAEQLLYRSWRYYQARSAYWPSAAACALLLAQNYLVQARYAPADRHARAVQQVLRERGKANTAEYARTLETRASVAKKMGRYDEAGQLYAQALAVGRQVPNAGGALANVLLGYADLQVTQGEVGTAQSYVAEAMRLLTYGTEPLQYPSQTGALNTAAYVTYAAGQDAAAAALYRRVLAINRRYHESQSVSTATALLGLGALETARHLARADSFLSVSLTMHRALLGVQHPATAYAQLGLAGLRLRQQRVQEAENLVEAARQGVDGILPSDHDMYGDLALAQGDVARSRNEAPTARRAYAHALAIYTRKFGPGHPKVRQLSRYR